MIHTALHGFVSRITTALLPGLVALALLLQGCATVTRGTSQKWSVESDPPGADVELTSGERCTTPCTLKKKRKYSFGVTVSKEGYESSHTAVVSRTAPAGNAGLAGNVILGGVIGIVLDANNGATKSLEPNPLHVTLAPIGEPANDVAAAPADPVQDAAPTSAATAAPIPSEEPDRRQ